MHPTAEHGFVQPDVYDRGRPDYPQGAVDVLELSPDHTVVDLGCGTGKFTAQLVSAGARVIGVEPLGGMLDAFRTNVGVPALRGLAEAMPIADAAIDVVVCASAFHWFDHGRALPEIARVLRDEGRLAIVWNRRDKLGDWSKEFWNITERYRGDTPGYRSGTWRTAIELCDRFGAIEEWSFEHIQRTDLDGLIARVASISFIEMLPDTERDAVIAESRRFLADHPETAGLDTFELPYRTALYVTRRAGS